jgi:hypothetical protein
VPGPCDAACLIPSSALTAGELTRIERVPPESASAVTGEEPVWSTTGSSFSVAPSLYLGSRPFRNLLGATPGAGADCTDPGPDGLVRIQGQLEAMVASSWRADHDMLLELEEVIYTLDAFDIRLGLHTSADGVVVWISDRDYRYRLDCLIERDRKGVVHNTDAVVRWLHEAAMRLFPNYARLYQTGRHGEADPSS